MIVRGQICVVERHSGQTKVHEPDARRPFVQHDVGGLHIAMNHTTGVRGSQPQRNLRPETNHFERVEFFSFGHVLAQRVARHKLHHEERHVTLLFDRVNRKHIGVVDGGGRTSLAQEAAACDSALCQMRAENLDRHGALQVGVEGLPHDPHSATTDLPFDVVFAELCRHRNIVGLAPKTLKRQLAVLGAFVRRFGTRHVDVRRIAALVDGGRRQLLVERGDTVRRITPRDVVVGIIVIRIRISALPSGVGHSELSLRFRIGLTFLLSRFPLTRREGSPRAYNEQLCLTWLKVRGFQAWRHQPPLPPKRAYAKERGG